MVSFEAPARAPCPDLPEDDALYKAMLRASPDFSAHEEPKSS
ncbi:hypothetical protein [Streptomyces sp. NPDC051636]